jgi:hypothetical protein
MKKSFYWFLGYVKTPFLLHRLYKSKATTVNEKLKTMWKVAAVVAHFNSLSQQMSIVTEKHDQVFNKSLEECAPTWSCGPHTTYNRQNAVVERLVIVDGTPEVPGSKEGPKTDSNDRDFSLFSHSLSRQVLTQYFETGHNLLVPHHFQLSIHTAWRYIICSAEKALNKPITSYPPWRTWRDFRPFNPLKPRERER